MCRPRPFEHPRRCRHGGAGGNDVIYQQEPRAVHVFLDDIRHLVDTSRRCQASFSPHLSLVRAAVLDYAVAHGNARHGAQQARDGLHVVKPAAAIRAFGRRDKRDEVRACEDAPVAIGRRNLRVQRRIKQELSDHAGKPALATILIRANHPRQGAAKERASQTAVER